MVEIFFLQAQDFLSLATEIRLHKVVLKIFEMKRPVKFGKDTLFEVSFATHVGQF